MSQPDAQFHGISGDALRLRFPIGALVRGKVHDITAEHVSIELEEGIVGTVEIYDMSWTRRINHPSEMLKKGDEVDAVVLDTYQQHVVLSMKQVRVDPWSQIETLFKIGAVVNGTVIEIKPFGAFVDLKDDVIGLVPTSQISDKLIKKGKAVLTVGQQVTARVIKFDHEERRLGLSIRAVKYSDGQLALETSAYETLMNSAGSDSLKTPVSPDAPPPVSNIEWFRNMMEEAPWLFDQKESQRVIRAYTLPGSAQAPSENPVPHWLRQKLAETTRNGHGLEQLVSEYVERLITRTDIPIDERATHLATETCDAMSLVTELSLASNRSGHISPACVSHANSRSTRSAVTIVQEFAELAETGDHEAVLHLLEIAEEAIAGLEARSPGIEEIVSIIAPTKEMWPQLCGALPEDFTRVKERLKALGVGTKTTVRKSYGGRGRPISYEVPVNLVAESLIKYIEGIRRMARMSGGMEVESAISQQLLTHIAELPDLDASTAKAWVRVAEEIVQECCGLALEVIPGLESLGVHRKGKTLRKSGDEPFNSDIRDGVRNALVQSFETLAARTSG